MMRALLASGAAGILLSGCTSVETAADPQREFAKAIASHCGKAYAGRMVSNEAADKDMAGKAMVMHVTSCDPARLTVPFHVGPGGSSDKWDRSRTWVITQTDAGLRLKHDHRHEDGSADAVTYYGGDTASKGTAMRQEFPVDAESIALFKANGLDRSVTNIWAVEISDKIFAYELRRPAGPNARYFRVEFDLTKPIAAPPPAWGWEN